MNQETPNKYLEKIKSILFECEDLKPLIPVNQITLKTRLQEDLGYDSLAKMSLLYELQTVKADLDESLIMKWTYIEDIIKDLE